MGWRLLYIVLFMDSSIVKVAITVVGGKCSTFQVHISSDYLLNCEFFTIECLECDFGMSR